MKQTDRTDDFAVTPELMDNRVIGHRPVSEAEAANLAENTPDNESVTQEMSHENNQNNTHPVDTNSPESTDHFNETDPMPETSHSTTSAPHSDEHHAPWMSNLLTRKKAAQEFSTTSKPQAGFKSWLGRHKKALGISGVIILLVISSLSAVGGYSYSVVSELKTQADEAEIIARTALDQFKAQNLPGSEQALKELETKVDQIDQTYQKLAYVKVVPIVNRYYADGTNGLVAAKAGVDAGLKAITAITPYADVLGFAAEDAVDPAAATAENRVKLLLETLQIILPTLDEINQDLKTASDALAQIDPNRYPEEIRGMAVRSQLVTAKETLANAQTILEDYRPIIEHLPSIAGSEGGRKKYLVLFQNDNELRPTGGFLTAYSVIYIENGVVTPEKSDDIYELDKKFSKRIAIPEALGRYLTTERYFNLRDMNISPDFKESMAQFYEHYQEVPGEPDNIDGIIAVDTHLLTGLLRVVGPVEIPGYGTFSAENDPRCDCPQIIYALSEIITKPTPYIREDRKGILAPLMQSVLQKIYSSPRTYMAELFNIGLESVDGKHLQVYFFNEEFQAAAEAIRAAGELENRTPEGDFLAIVNANLGGAKSNLFVKYDSQQTIEGPVDGKITKTVEITYKNPRRADNCNLEAGLLCLNSTLRDWTRIYVPAGSELVSAQGFTEQPTVYEENGFQVFDGFFILEPLGQAKLRVTYTVPYDNPEYDLTIWKQGGTDPIEHIVDVNGGQEIVVVNKDLVYSTQF